MTVTCPRCKGRRFRMGRQCLTCRGHGVIPAEVAEEIAAEDMEARYQAARDAEDAEVNYWRKS